MAEWLGWRPLTVLRGFDSYLGSFEYQSRSTSWGAGVLADGLSALSRAEYPPLADSALANPGP